MSRVPEYKRNNLYQGDTLTGFTLQLNSEEMSTYIDNAICQIRTVKGHLCHTYEINASGSNTIEIPEVPPEITLTFPPELLVFDIKVMIDNRTITILTGSFKCLSSATKIKMECRDNNIELPS